MSCLESTVPRCVWLYHIQLHSERFYQDSIHSNSNDISSHEGERSAHHIAFVICWMLDDNDMYQSMMIVSLTLWWQYGKYHPASDEGIEKQNSISSNMNDISSCEGDSCYFTLHLLDDTDMLSRISSVIMSHRVHIQTIPWDAERKHI